MRKLLISRTINSEEFSASFFLSNAKQLVILGEISFFFFFFNACCPTKSYRLSNALLGYTFKDLCSVYGVWNALLENVQFAQARAHVLIQFQHISEASQKISLKCNVKARCCTERVLCWFELYAKRRQTLVQQARLVLKSNTITVTLNKNVCWTVMRCWVAECYTCCDNYLQLCGSLAYFKLLGTFKSSFSHSERVSFSALFIYSVYTPLCAWKIYICIHYSHHTHIHTHSLDKKIKQNRRFDGINLHRIVLGLYLHVSTYILTVNDIKS